MTCAASKIALIALAISLFPVSLVSRVEAPAPSSAGYCSSADYRRFDFWIGNWDVFDVAAPKVVSAHVRVDSILGGCVLHEQYQDPSGARGESFTIFDSTRGVWHQTWVTNHGRLLTIEGKFESGQMVLQGSDLTADHKHRIVRGIWKAEDGGVRETAATSLDDGKTWQPWFDLLFRAAAPAANVKGNR